MACRYLHVPRAPCGPTYCTGQRVLCLLFVNHRSVVNVSVVVEEGKKIAVATEREVCYWVSVCARTLFSSIHFVVFCIHDHAADVDHGHGAARGLLDLRKLPRMHNFCQKVN